MHTHERRNEADRDPLAVDANRLEGYRATQDLFLPPRNGRSTVRKPAHLPAPVLVCTACIPAPSASHAHARWPCLTGTCGHSRWLYLAYAAVERNWCTPNGLPARIADVMHACEPCLNRTPFIDAR